MTDQTPRTVQSQSKQGPLNGIEREMAKSYVLVHSRLINKHLRDAEGSASARMEFELALREARSVVATLERLLVR